MPCQFPTKAVGAMFDARNDLRIVATPTPCQSHHVTERCSPMMPASRSRAHIMFFRSRSTMSDDLDTAPESSCAAVLPVHLSLTGTSPAAEDGFPAVTIAHDAEDSPSQEEGNH